VKRLADLTADDLLNCPVWRYHGSNDASARVTPAPLQALTDEPRRPVFIALTEFVLANGLKHLGYSSPDDPSGLDYVQPVIILDGIHVALWCDERGEVSREIVVRLGLDEVEAFPIRWRCTVPVGDDIIQGVIPGDEISTPGQ